MSQFPPNGYLRNVSLARMLVDFNRSRVTGRFKVTSQGATKSVYLQNGNAVFATSTYDDDRLGEMLIKAGLATFNHVDEAVQNMKQTGNRLGTALVELGYISPQDLFWGVKHQTQEIIFSLFQLRDGLYEFTDEHVPDEIITLDLSMSNIIMEGMRRVDNFTRIKTELPETSNILMFSDDPRNLFQQIEMTDKERSVMGLIDGDRTINEVLEASELNNFETLKVLYVLWSVGVVTEQFNLRQSGLTVDEILEPVADEKDEFIARVNSIHAVLGSMSDYKLLAVNETDDFESITRQYYKLTKEFHPDRYSDIQDSTIKDKMSSIFDAITAAYHSLKKRQYMRQFTEGDADLAQELLKISQEEISKGNFTHAVEYLSEAIKSDPDNAECWYYFSLVKSWLPGGLEQAQDAALNAHGLAPDNSLYATHLGNIYVLMNETEQAAQMFQTALELDPDNATAKDALKDLQ